MITLADLTDFDAAQARQRQADRAQRDALVREVHHRIKNNLQGIIGMLHTMALHHPRLGDEIRQLGAQVQSIAIVHGLQGRQTGEEIELGELMHAVAEGVGRALNSTLNVIETTPPTLTLPTTRLARDEAVPIALVLNELMTNAIKHGDGTHVARVALSLAGGGAVITLTNPGHWNPPAVHAPSPTGRGLELVRLLLPREGARLAHTTQDGQVVTTLTLAAPVLQIAHG